MRAFGHYLADLLVLRASVFIHRFVVLTSLTLPYIGNEFHAPCFSKTITMGNIDVDDVAGLDWGDHNSMFKGPS